MRNSAAGLELGAIDLSAFAAGNGGIPYVWTYSAEALGPHLMICALIHGNEVCGAHAVADLLEDEIRPVRGRLTLAFANIAAYETFDAANPAASRFLDEDLNRVWAADVLDSDRRSRELARARAPVGDRRRRSFARSPFDANPVPTVGPCRPDCKGPRASAQRRCAGTCCR